MAACCSSTSLYKPSVVHAKTLCSANSTLITNGAIVMSVSCSKVINHTSKFAVGYKSEFLLLPRLLLFGLCCWSSDVALHVQAHGGAGGKQARWPQNCWQPCGPEQPCERQKPCNSDPARTSALSGWLASSACASTAPGTKSDLCIACTNSCFCAWVCKMANGLLCLLIFAGEIRLV